MKTKVLIVDDEGPARRRLRASLSPLPGVEIVGEAADGLAAVEAIRSLSPDVVFLDVQMPGMTGFEVIDAIGPAVMPAVVFVTAFDEFALEAFEVEAVDYLLKPFVKDRLEKALERASRRAREKGNDGAALSRLLSALAPGPRYLRRLVVRKGERLVLLDVGQISRLSAEGNYVKVHAGETAYLVRGTLASLETRLDPERFARIHRSEIVAVDAVKEIEPWFHGDHVVVLKNGEKRRLSRRYQGRLLRDLGGERSGKD